MFLRLHFLISPLDTCGGHNFESKEKDVTGIGDNLLEHFVVVSQRGAWKRGRRILEEVGDDETREVEVSLFKRWRRGGQFVREVEEVKA